jgi:hypothetical protein
MVHGSLWAMVASAFLRFFIVVKDNEGKKWQAEKLAI